MLKYLPGTKAMGCSGAEGVMLPYLRALYGERSRLATTVEEKLDAAYVLFSIETIELGADEALIRAGPREGTIRSGAGQ